MMYQKASPSAPAAFGLFLPTTMEIGTIITANAIFAVSINDDRG